LNLDALSGENISFLEEIYLKYKNSSHNIENDYIELFNNLPLKNDKTQDSKISHTVKNEESFESMALQDILNNYRKNGHLAANLDPLYIKKPQREVIENTLKNISDEKLKIEFDSKISGLEKTSLNKIIKWFETAYCGSMGCEHYYLVNQNERDWLSDRIESPSNIQPLSTWVKLRIFEKICQAEYFEQFLAKKYIGKKRFSLEGGESLIPLLDVIVETAGFTQMEGLTIGMAHRGRLNVLANIFRKPLSEIFAEFEENFNPLALDYTDVKYHLGYSNQVMTEAKKEIKISLGFNPSHLEAANSIIMGQVRSRQDYINDKNGSKYLGILIHGDAAFAGQGIVAESLNLMNLNGYTTKGILHIVINNQIGFTAEPEESRSTLYATDLAKGFQIPIFHVNADDPEAVFRVARLAMLYRNKFKKDVIIDLICYRRLGHNEMDEPAFTQPMMYSKIKDHPTTLSLYEKKLLNDKDIKNEDIEFIKKGIQNALDNSFETAHKKNIKTKVDTMGNRWSTFLMHADKNDPKTSLTSEKIQSLGKSITSTPEEFNAHSKIIRLLEGRKKMLNREQPVDWGFSEALAFASLLDENIKIRFSGQDAARGTFSHRQAVLSDIENGNKYTPLNNISSKQGHFEIINSPLSEFSVLGFEYGYSLSYPEALVIWEAQFGDFFNGAQIIFDQFISSAEIKWLRFSGLVMLLPHGYEGQGPEHSSARIERFLQLCAANNIQLCNLTRSVQLFHLLRRQALRKNRKPLVIFSPKSLLRLTEAASDIKEFSSSSFKEVIEDDWQADNSKVKRLLLCSGKVYYDLLSYKNNLKTDKNNTACARLEQIYPVSENNLKKIFKSYKNLKEVLWVQEEPVNMGAWFFINPILKSILPETINLNVAARDASPSPAVGFYKKHEKELKTLMEKSFH